MDRFSFVAQARAKVLVVPINNLNPTKFSRYFHQIKSTFDIRLLDVSPIPDSKYFNPQAFPQGRVLYDFLATEPEEETKFLYDFEPFRKTFIVIGVGEYDPNTTTGISQLKEKCPSAIVHNCILFNSPSDLVQKSGPDTFYLRQLEELNITDMETTICSITRNFLVALDEHALSYENITLRSPISLIDSNVLTRTINYAQKRLSSGSAYKVSFSNGQDVVKSADLKIRASQRQSGRHLKLMGNFFLLAGRFNDALQYFTDAVINCKKCDDYLWLASALEGLAVSSFLLLDLGLPFHVQNPMLAPVLQVPRNRLLTLGNNSHKASTESNRSRLASNVVSPRNSTLSSLGFGLATATLTGTLVDFSAMPLPDYLRILCERVSQFYQLSASEIEDCVPDLVYVESLIRNIKLMMTIYLVGLGPLSSVFASVIKSTPVAAFGARDGSIFAKSDIIAEIDKVFSLQLVDLEFSEQCRIYCTLASVYADLKLYRKQAFILRILLVALLPEVARLESNSHPNSSKATTKANSKANSKSLSTSSITSIFSLLFKVYRIDLEPETSGCGAKDHISDWSTLQILLIKICLRIAEAQHDYATLAKLCVLTFTRYSHCLLAEDQTKLRGKLNWLNLWLGENDPDQKMPYPDPFMVRQVKFVPGSSDSNLTPFAEVENTSSTADGAIIFNPFNKTKGAAKERTICVDEVHQVKFTLQNPFPHEVELSDISLVTNDEVTVETLKNLVKKLSSTPLVVANEFNGVNWSQPRKPVPVNGVLPPSGPESVILPANNTTQLTVSFRAQKTGALTIKGLRVRAANSAFQTFLISDTEVACGLQKVKLYGPRIPDGDDSALDRLIENLALANISGRVSTLELTLNVIPRQPVLTMTKNLITNGWIMLLEGELQRFSLELKNTSNEPVNYLSFSFWDSASDTINSNFSQPGTFSAEDVYELEWNLIKNKPFSVLNKQEISQKHKVIKPNDNFQIEYEVFGKRGMTELKLILEYSNKSTGQNFMKTVSVPLNVSIQPSLEITGCDIIPFFSSSLNGYVTGIEANSLHQRNINSLLDVIKGSESEVSAFALLVLDVKNSWKQRLALKMSNDFILTFTITETLNPTETCRFLLPVKRIGNDTVDVTKPIPSLRNKQFIKNYNISEFEEAQERKSFWVKSALLEGLKGQWSTVGPTNERSGHLDLRCIRLSPAMTNVLSYDNVQIHQSIYDDQTGTEVLRKNNAFDLEREKFYVLKTQIVNYANEPFTGVLRHLPFPVHAATKLDLSIEQKILYNGLLQRHINTPIEKGQTYEISLGFLILEKGKYEWGTMLDVTGTKYAPREPVFINAS